MSQTTIEGRINKLISTYKLDCYIVFNKDAHLNEYIRKKDMRVMQICGFTGSNATLIICDSPQLLTDSRYYIQAQQQSRFPLVKEQLSKHITKTGYKRIGFDTKTISSASFKKLSQIFSENGMEFVETPTEMEDSSSNETDDIIYLENYKLSDYFRIPGSENGGEATVREYLSSLGFTNFDSNVTGSKYNDKITRIREYIDMKPLIIAELDTIAWILNLRGCDIEFNPLFFAFMIIDSSSVMLFTDKKVVLEGVSVLPYSSFEKHLSFIANAPVLISGDCNQYIYSQLKHPELTGVIRGYQACKNDVELCGMALAYLFDGIALTELFAFIEAGDNLTEDTVSQELENIKKRFEGYVQPSFGTISSTGSNAAIVHHQSSSDKIDKNKVYLIDSGSHYYFGTTDTTRTLFFGTDVPSDLKHDYTLVLQGQLDAMMKKYKDAPYSKIDIYSRKYLNDEKKVFGHAVGHGVGHFLCVHENPPVIYDKITNQIEANQVFSIEPGYYKEGEYGIRIENLVISKQVEEFIELVNITLVPYQNKMVDCCMMTEEQKKYYNQCNKKCMDILYKHLGDKARAFLEANTCPIE